MRTSILILSVLGAFALLQGINAEEHPPLDADAFEEDFNENSSPEDDKDAWSEDSQDLTLADASYGNGNPHCDKTKPEGSKIDGRRRRNKAAGNKNKSGAGCQFPMMYKGKNYNKCTKDGCGWMCGDVAWCYTTPTKNGEPGDAWGECVDECINPPPTKAPTKMPTGHPTKKPTWPTAKPTAAPVPTKAPTMATKSPTKYPTARPTALDQQGNPITNPPTPVPTKEPTRHPTTIHDTITVNQRRRRTQKNIFESVFGGGSSAASTDRPSYALLLGICLMGAVFRN